MSMIHYLFDARPANLKYHFLFELAFENFFLFILAVLAAFYQVKCPYPLAFLASECLVLFQN